MIALVCGGRDFDDDDLLYRTLDAENPSCILQGGAQGADLWAKNWAYKHGVPEFECRAQWKNYGKGAGPKRNAWMLTYMRPDIVIAFPTPSSRGTWDMIRQAEKADIPTLVVKSSGQSS